MSRAAARVEAGITDALQHQLAPQPWPQLRCGGMGQLRPAGGASDATTAVIAHNYR
jgi:hypothetical protein